MHQASPTIIIDEQATVEQTARLARVLLDAAPYEAAKQIAQNFLGARKVGDRQALFGFWVPGLTTGALQDKAEQIKLELFTPLIPIDFGVLRRGAPIALPFQRDRVQLTAVGDYMIGVVNGVQVGTCTQAGAFYWLRYTTNEERYILRDPLVASTPFGVYAPGELFDVQGMLVQRRDMAYFKSWYKTIYPDGS